MTHHTDGWVRRRAWSAPLAVGAALAVVLGPTSSAAQTWTGGRKTPVLDEIVAIDKTGEPRWPFGGEDVAGDGAARFEQPERSIDFRTAYAVADAGRLWARAYVSETAAISGAVTLYVFIDADRNRGTGGTAEATEIDPNFTIDGSPGGYEYVLGVKGDGTLADVWAFRASGNYERLTVPAEQVATEVGTDVDPVLINEAVRGYVQGAIDLGVVGVTAACDANLYFRSVSGTAGLGPGDLDIGISAPCVPGDADSDRVPDVIVPPSGCTWDGDCAGRGVCVDGACVLPVSCVEDTDCDADEECSPDWRCVPVPSGTCTTNAECDGLVCANGRCGPCAPGGAECGPDARCAPTGVCVEGAASGGAGSSGAGGPDGPWLEPGDEVRGGACACAAGPAPYGGGALSLLAAGGLALRLRRRPRRGHGTGR
ncbi:hypothetical protein SOCEGT47_054940 [Sorangium cellulosum]|uniref:Secreted protein n=1 Tax=Sorangium cellulosum TaxID=56 RepID=A0A4P2Q7G0_SORCE|nr:hypothetical protein [Sorangium cellulosum]AUX24953.1 hypothetical protein SOCEGT47_054940 [Sorangium cellulosum]